MSYIETDILSGYDSVTIKDGEVCILVPLEDYWSMAFSEGEATAYKNVCEKLISKM